VDRYFADLGATSERLVYEEAPVAATADEA
jgi:hypothetical protein